MKPHIAKQRRGDACHSEKYARKNVHLCPGRQRGATPRETTWGRRMSPPEPREKSNCFTRILGANMEPHIVENAAAARVAPKTVRGGGIITFFHECPGRQHGAMQRGTAWG